MIFQARSVMKEKEILDKFRHGDGPDNEDIKMFKLALQRLHEEEDELVKNVHWAHYPSDILSI